MCEIAFLPEYPGGNPRVARMSRTSAFQYGWPVFRETFDTPKKEKIRFAIDFHHLRRFVKDVLFYVAMNDEKLDVLSRKVFSLRRKMEPEGRYFTEDIGILTINLVKELRRNDWYKFNSNALQWKYSRAMLQSEEQYPETRFQWWMIYRVRKHYQCLGTRTLHEFFIYLAYISKFCINLMLDGTHVNELECVTVIGAEMIYWSWFAFPNYGLLQHFAAVKKFTVGRGIPFNR